jgi:hypothetical protein
MSALPSARRHGPSECRACDSDRVRFTHSAGACTIGPQSVDGLGHGDRLGRDNAPRLVVDDEFERTTRIGAGDDRLAREHRLKRDIAIILVFGAEKDRKCARVKRPHLVPADGPKQSYSRLQGKFTYKLTHSADLTTLAHQQSTNRRLDEGHCANQQFLAFRGFEAAGEEYIRQRFAAVEFFGLEWRVVKSNGVKTIAQPQSIGHPPADREETSTVQVTVVKLADALRQVALAGSHVGNARLIGGTVLVQKPGRLARMTQAIRRKF